MTVARAAAVWNAVGLVLFVVMVFPVFWMISTAFKPDDQINSLDADVVPAPPDAARTSRDAIAQAVLLGPT